MPSNNPPQAPTLELGRRPSAGDVSTFPGGRVSYLAPLPLPTGLPARDHAHAVGEVNDTYLDFGVGLPPVFGWQLTLGGPFSGWIMSVVLLPLIGALLVMLVGGGSELAFEAIVELSSLGLGIGSLVALGTLALGLGIWLNKDSKRQGIFPTRFNRQRREVCFVPEGHTEPVFVSWESLSAWVIEAQGATQYGIQRQYGMGVGFHHAESGEDYSLEFPCSGFPLAIANWEAIRAYMEYRVHSLKEIQDPFDLQGPDDPPHEGLHTFHNARARMRRRYRDGEVGVFYVAGWYLYHLMTLWTLPFRLTDWEVARAKRQRRQDLPAALREWSQPLPPEQWAKPSAELQHQSRQVEELRRRNPQHSLIEIFAEVRRGAVKKPA